MPEPLDDIVGTLVPAEWLGVAVGVRGVELAPCPRNRGKFKTGGCEYRDAVEQVRNLSIEVRRSRGKFSEGRA